MCNSKISISGPQRTYLLLLLSIVWSIVAASPTAAPTSSPTSAPTLAPSTSSSPTTSTKPSSSPTGSSCPATKPGEKITTTLDFSSPPALSGGVTSGSLSSYCGFTFSPPPLAVDCGSADCVVPAKDWVLFTEVGVNTTITRTDGGIFTLNSFGYWDSNLSFTGLNIASDSKIVSSEMFTFPSMNTGTYFTFPLQISVMDVTMATFRPLGGTVFAFSLSNLTLSFIP